MTGLVAFLIVASGSLIFAHFIPELSARLDIIYYIAFPIIVLLTNVALYFGLTHLLRKTDELEHKGEIERLQRELAITKKRVSAGKTTIEYPPGYMDKKKAVNE